MPAEFPVVSNLLSGCRVALALAVTVAAPAFALLWRGPTLTWVTVSAADVEGKPVRYRMLVPKGWAAPTPPMSAIVPIKDGLPPMRMFFFGPIREPHSGSASRGGITIITGPPRRDVWHCEADGETHLSTWPAIGSLPASKVAARRTQGRLGATLVYHQPDPPYFESTYRRVCGSLHVVQ